MKKAVQKTIEEHRLSGDPIVIWRDGKVVKIPADQIEVCEPEGEYKARSTDEEQNPDGGE